MPLTNVYRIMIVDDHPIVREGYIQLVSHQDDFEICGVAESIAEAFPAAMASAPDLIMVDLNLKDGSGLELIKSIRNTNNKVKLLVVSVHDELLFAERVIRAGANGYINKQDAIEHLHTAMREVLQGGIYLNPRVSQNVLPAGDGINGQSPIRDSQLATLSDRELEVLRQLGEGDSTKRIARKLNISPKTVDRHRENIKRKLNLAHANDLIRLAATWVVDSA